MCLLPLLLLLLQSSGVAGFASTKQRHYLQRRHPRSSSSVAPCWPTPNSVFQTPFQHQQRNYYNVLKRVSSILLRSTNVSNGNMDDDFTALGLSAELVATITTGMGWTKPTNIQRLAIPAILNTSSSSSSITNKEEEEQSDDANNDYDSVWCTSPTGSGKTASFALPILQLIMQQKQQLQQQKPRQEEDRTERRRMKHHRSRGDGSSSSSSSGKPTALILCPTRELAIQTYSVFMELLSHINRQQLTATTVTIRAIYGGTSSSSSFVNDNSSSSSSYNDNDNVDIVVATPGRLLDVLHLGPTKSSRASASDVTLNEEEEDDEDPRKMAALERRILMALDAKSSSSSSSSSYNERNDGVLRKSKMKRGGSSSNNSRGSSRSNSISSSYYEESTTSLDIDEIQRLLEGIDDDDDDDDNEDTITATASSDMLHGLQYLIIDEADRLLGKAFENEIDLLLSLTVSSSTVSSSRSRRRASKLKTMLFSATFPKQIENRVERVLSQLDCDSTLRLSTATASTTTTTTTTTTTMSELNNTNNAGNSILLSSFYVDNYGKESSNNNNNNNNNTSNDDVVADMDDMHTSDHEQFVNDNSINDVPRIQHRVIRLNETDRTRALCCLITNKEKEKEQQYNMNKVGSEGNDDDEVMMEERILVFVATRHSAEHVSKKLNKYNIRASELHGKLNQADRDRTLNAFRCGKVHVLVATDLAARGLDVHGLSTVINYDLPRSPDDFIHRAGRTGRAGYGGTSITFITAQTESHFNYLEKKVLLQPPQPPTSTSLSLSTGKIEREVLDGFVINEMTWTMQAATSTANATHSELGLGHDRTFGGIKGRRKSKKDKLREAAGAAAA